MHPFSIKSKTSIQKNWLERFRGDLGNGADGVSAATYNAERDLWIIVRQTSTADVGNFYEYKHDLTTTGRQWTIAGGLQDTESVDWMYGDVYLVTEENRTTAPTQHRMNIMALTGSGTLNLTRDVVRPNFLPSSGWFNNNLGIEGSAWDKSRDLYYFLYETAHATSGWFIWRTDYSGFNTVPLVNLTTELSGIATDVSDMVLDASTNRIYVLADVNKKVLVFSSTSRKFLESFALPADTVTSTSGFGQPEGLAFDARHGRMLVVGENRQGALYQIKKCGNKVGIGVANGIAQNQRYL
jgi:uncharacterized protein YjiK